MSDILAVQPRTPRKYFTLRPLRILRVYAVFDSITDHFDELDDDFLSWGSSNRYLDEVYDEWVCPAELELIDRLARDQIYGSLLRDQQIVVDYLSKAYQEQGFPVAKNAEKQLRRLARRLGVHKDSFTSETFYFYQINALCNMVPLFGTLSPLEDPAVWGQPDWDNYFNAHPLDEIVLPALFAIKQCREGLTEAEWGKQRSMYFGRSIKTMLSEQQRQHEDESDEDESYS